MAIRFGREQMLVLVVDDDLNIREMLSSTLAAAGHTVQLCANASEAIDASGQHRFDAAFMDLRIGTESGLGLANILLAQNLWLKVAMIAGFSSIDSAVESNRMGALAYLPKPFTPDQVRATLARFDQGPSASQ